MWVECGNDATGSQKAGNIMKLAKLGSAFTAAHADGLMFFLYPPLVSRTLDRARIPECEVRQQNQPKLISRWDLISTQRKPLPKGSRVGKFTLVAVQQHSS